MSNNDFKRFWDKGIQLDGLPDTYGTYGRKFELDVDKPFLNEMDVRKRVNKARLYVEAKYPGMYSMQVNVRDRNDGKFKSGKYRNTSVKEFLIWSPDDYASEFQTATPHKGKGLEADSVFITFYRFDTPMLL